MIGERNTSWSTTVGMMYNAVLFPKTISVPSSGGAGVLSTTIQDPKSLIFPLCASSRICGEEERGGGGEDRLTLFWSWYRSMERHRMCVQSFVWAFIHSQQQQLEAKKDTSPTSLSPSLMEITVFLEGGVSSPLSLSLFLFYRKIHISSLEVEGREWSRAGKQASEQVSKIA